MVQEFQKIIKYFSKIGERQNEGAKEAAFYITNLLKQNKIFFHIQKFNTDIPVGKSSLFADGKKINSLPSSYVSGKIDSNFSISSSLIPSRYLIDVPNINFNPQCREISRSNMYLAPAISISREDVSKIINAKKIKGNVNVKKVKRKNEQMLVGNMINPEKIIFSHYDSIGPGIIDNASGVALTLVSILSNPELLLKNLFVFDGNEELSYDCPTYWGRGYREFFGNNNSIFQKNNIYKKAKEIIVVDCVGYGKCISYVDGKITNLAFPVSDEIRKNIPVTVLSGEYETLMLVYHSDLDDGRMLEEKYIKEAFKTFLTKV